jgi:SH3-like domain-containing protein
MDTDGSAYETAMVKRREKKLFANLVMLVASLAAFPAYAALDLKPVPYWASLKANEVYMRVGPGEDYRINWIYHRQHLPLKVLRIMQNWRLVEDPEGDHGWIMVNMLVIGHDGFVIGKDPAEMHETADGNSRLLWRLEPGVLGKVGDCTAGWCKFTVNGRAGYVPQDALWGARDLTPGR